MSSLDINRVVHLELHTPELAQARALYAELFGWRAERVHTANGSYLALALGAALGGGLVDCPIERPLWLPYVEVRDIERELARALAAGATVLLEPREGPAGWRAVIHSAAGGELALWQFKRDAPRRGTMSLAARGGLRDRTTDTTKGEPR
jgi:predicted enzyme related to lactoylglutathione lyase